MKIPLEPIPTEQLVTPEKTRIRPSVQLNQTEDTQQKAVINHRSPSVSPLYKVYPWLLGASVCLSAVLCWMYVTKPVITAAPIEQSTNVPQIVYNDGEQLPDEGNIPLIGTASKSSLLPSDDQLPGETRLGKVPLSSNGESGGDIVVAQAPTNMGEDLSAGGIGWENTNLKVQHILRADSGNGNLEKIILTVPVRYESRTMRWTPQDTQQARNILSRLMVYERDLNNLRQQGQSILKDWNGLLSLTVPSNVLRADSPSLPYNRGYATEPQNFPNSSSVIKVGGSESINK